MAAQTPSPGQRGRSRAWPVIQASLCAVAGGGGGGGGGGRWGRRGWGRGQLCGWTDPGQVWTPTTLSSLPSIPSKWRAGGEAGWFCAQTMQPAPWGTDDPAPWDPALAPPTAAAAPAAALPPPGSAGAGAGAVPASGQRGRHPLAGPAGRQAAGGDREEALPVPRDQGPPAAGQEPVQAGQHARPAQLETDPRGQQGGPPKPAGPAGRPVGHRHLRMAARVSGVFTLLLWAGFGARIFGERLFRPIRRTDGNRGRRPPEHLRGWSEVSGIKGGTLPR
ncbi:hypothetical protein ANANG_G00166180 [Anguilla anguilla]|uniref:Uncharacterized protein n=1 Tax=Anguilla anguilla TaxID=7936 RepID=A0A9D3RX46_ANGAN|nr:hypothetical protein ANANG_G00166180 [Anguilla anguilla]